WKRPCGLDTNIFIYNHNVREKVPLVLSNPNILTWYTCGPTVYDSTHIGHASTYVKVDIIQRILRDYFKYNLVTAMNITDVDDKIIKRSKETRRNWQELSRYYEAEFKQDMLNLNVKPPNLRANVTSNISAIQRFIAQLLADQKAYVTEDRSVYFDVSQCQTYGKLHKFNKNDNKLVIKPESDKRSSADFALWKVRKEPEEPSWPASWGGHGRPGWHIECSTIAGMFFGNQLDIHAGGMDLRFPHHENEEAQSCAHYKKPQWVNYWLHTGQLSVVGEQHKMSKSLGNTITVSEFLKYYTADEFRMACLLSNYRNAMAYSDELMQTARQTLKKFQNFHADLTAYLQLKKPLKFLDQGAMQAQLRHMVKEFDDSLRDDFDTARAISVLIDQMSSISRCINDQQPDAEQEPAACIHLLLAAANFISVAMQNFGIKQQGTGIPQPQELVGGLNTSTLIADILELRSSLREQALSSALKDSQLLVVCDQLRELLQNQGLQVRDHQKGSTLI
ncbi:hypothetical protein KR222_000754, partial [Zaprionus bogoriensis]